MIKKEFLKRILMACEIANDKGARFNKAVMVAQAALESGWGNSFLAKHANNLFGIKAGRSWKGETIELPTNEFDEERGWYKTSAVWRKYMSWNECIVDYSKIISSMPWFRDALKYLDNADGFLRALLPAPGEPGWARDPSYFEKVRACGVAIEKLGGPKWA